MIFTVAKFRVLSCKLSHLHIKTFSSIVPLTKDRYTGLNRWAFNCVEDADLRFFRRTLGETNVLVNDLDSFNTDWLRTVRGQSKVVLRPQSTDEVSQILKYCNERRLAICPQGGNTGLVGGGVPVFDEIIVSTSRMNKIMSIDSNSSTVVCQAGCILEALDKELSKYDLMMPLDLGAKGSCHIGGNISTNAGGIRLLRYGSLHANVLGLEVVLPSGIVLNGLSPLIKDNTGYDLKHLFIGSEGTLGVVTAATIKCPPRPTAVNVALLSCDSFTKCVELLMLSRLHIGEILSAFEFMDIASRETVCSNLRLTFPLAEAPFYILIETSGSNESHDQEKLGAFLELVMGKSIVQGGVVASDRTQMLHIWSLRERLAEALLKDGYCYKYDISLPIALMYDLVVEMRSRLNGTSALRCVGYGHLGDGNLHLNVTSPKYDEAVLNQIEPFVYDWTAAKHGSISAEHGLGFKKKNFIFHSKSKEMVQAMTLIKRGFDPNGIMNPYKVFPDSVLTKIV